MADLEDMSPAYWEKPVLKLLANNTCTFKQLPEKLNISEEKIVKILEYLKELGAVDYKSTMSKGFEGIVAFKVTAQGHAYTIHNAQLYNKPTPNNHISVSGGQIGNIAQNVGDNADINQTNIITITNILKEIIEHDEELEDDNKSKLLKILEKFNTISETKENLGDLLKEVKTISSKYLPYFFTLLPAATKALGLG